MRRLVKFAAITWRIKTDPIGYARSLGVEIGRDARLLDLNGATFGSEPYLVRLGDHVTVTSGVRFVTHDGGVWVLRDEIPDLDVVAPITVGNNVFIGLQAILLPGVTIGDDCVIGAGSVVTRDIPSGSVAAGIPARVLSSIDDYRERALRVGHRIRNLPPDEKRALLTRRLLTDKVDEG